MSKKNKKWNELRIKANAGQKTTEKSSAEIFFRKIGIRRQGSGDNKVLELEMPVRNLQKPELLDGFRKAMEQMDKTQSLLKEFFHTGLPLVKIFYGNSLNRLNLVAEALKQVSIPANSRILDIGGGPGHLAFWMTEIWKDCSVTVADKYSLLGYQWAKEIGNLQVQFIDTLLPRLGLLSGQQFDVVVLSRVLSCILLLDLPTHTNTYSYEDYLASSEGQNLIRRLELLVQEIPNLLQPGGIVVLVESWSPIRVLLMEKVFETRGLYLNPQLFDPYRIGIEYSAAVFSKKKPISPIENPGLAITTITEFGQEKEFGNISAESARKLFDGGTPIASLEYWDEKNKGSVLTEILEKEGLMVLYVTTTEGYRAANIFPAVQIPRYLEQLRTLEITSTREPGIKILKSHFPSLN